jgi:hypothetical protein
MDAMEVEASTTISFFMSLNCSFKKLCANKAQLPPAFYSASDDFSTFLLVQIVVSLFLQLCCSEAVFGVVAFLGRYLNGQ